MGNTTKERTIAIFLVQSFRKLLDETMKPSNKPSHYLDLQVSVAMDSFFGKELPNDPELVNKLRKLFESIGSDFVLHLSYQYEEKLPNIIVNAMSDIEAHLSSTYTSHELEEMVQIIQFPVAQKLINDMSIFGIFRKYRNMMFVLLERELLDYVNDVSVKDKFKNSVQDLIDDVGQDDNDEGTGHSLNPDDIF